jgi:hypothetical protein
MKRRVPAYIIGGVGVLLILMTFGTNLFWVGPAFQRLTNDFRPEFRSSEVAALRQDVNGLAATQTEFTSRAVPALASALKVTPQQFQAQLAQKYPAVAAGVQNAPTVTQEFNGVLNLIDQEQGRFAKADAIPTKSLPANSVPWGLAVAGLGCIGVAFLVSRRPGAVLAVALGVALVVAPLVMTLPSKADAADTMNSHFKPIYTAEFVAKAQQSLTGMKAMGAELQTKLIPDLATQMHMTPAQLQGYLQSNFPTMTAGMAAMPAAFARFDKLVGAFDSSLDNYKTLKPVKLVPIVWATIVAGLLVAGTAGLGLVQGAAAAPAVEKQRRPALRQRLAHQ